MKNKYVSLFLCQNNLLTNCTIYFSHTSKELYLRKMNAKVALNRHLNMRFIASIRKKLYFPIHNLSMILSMCRGTILFEPRRKSVDNWKQESRQYLVQQILCLPPMCNQFAKPLIYHILKFALI